MRNEPVELDGNGGSIMLNVRTYDLPRADEPRRVSIAVPANRREPIPVAEGNLVTLHVTGKICRDEHCFGPEGRQGFWSNSYRLRARVDDETQDVEADSSFVVQHTGDLEMFVDDADPRLKGAFRVEVQINPPGSRNALEPSGIALRPTRRQRI